MRTMPLRPVPAALIARASGSAALVVLVIAAGCGPDVRAGAVPPEVLAAVGGADSAVVEPGTAARPAAPVPASYPVVLYSDLDADVGARKDGVLTGLAVELGDAVVAGQVIAQLESLRETARRDAAADALELVRAEHARAAVLKERQVIAGADYDAALLRLRSAEAALREAEVELELTRVVAPFTGVVTRRYLGLGHSVTEGEALYRITALQPLRALVRLPERSARALARGAGALLHSDVADPPAVVPATVSRISPAVDAASGTVEVVLLVPRPGPLRPGSAATVEFAGGS